MPSAIIDQLDTYGPDRCELLSYEQACNYTRDLARSQYENFTVVSWLLPKRLRDDFRHVYSFCRWADDLGDETGDCQRSVELLTWWRRELDACYDGRPRHPVFVALMPTIQKHDIPRKPFDDLIDAFVQDQTITRYDRFEDVCDYCTRSANPVGRLVLYLCGYRDEHRQTLSDATCSALQLANFWQDVRRDILERDRAYLPRDVAGEHGLDLDAMVAAVKAEGDSLGGAVKLSAATTAMLPAYCSAVRVLCERTQAMFDAGRALWPLVDAKVRLDLKLFTLGGEHTLKSIKKLDYNTLAVRPTVGKGAKLSLMIQAVAGKLMGKVRPGGKQSGKHAEPPTPDDVGGAS